MGTAYPEGPQEGADTGTPRPDVTGEARTGESQVVAGMTFRKGTTDMQTASFTAAEIEKVRLVPQSESWEGGFMDFLWIC